MNLNGWEIDLESLLGPERGTPPLLYFTDAVYPSPDDAYAVLLYSITEIRMGWDVGRFALFTDRERPRLIENPEGFLCCHTDDSVIWLSNELFATRKLYYDSSTRKSNIPFTLVDLARNEYSFIPQVNSYPYGLVFDGATVKLVERRRDPRFPSRDGERHKLQDLPWYRLSQLEDFDKHYADYAK